MSDQNNGTPPGAADVIAAALTKAGFSGEEAGALLDQAMAARPAAAPAAARPTPAAPGGNAKTYSLEEIQAFGRALGLGGAGQASAAPMAPSGPPITSRSNPPPPGKPTENTPILSMSEADRRALASEIGDVKFADRLIKEMVRDRVRVGRRS